MTKIAAPTAIRLSVSFAAAVYTGNHSIEGVRAQLCSAEAWRAALRNGCIAVLVDPKANILLQTAPAVMVDELGMASTKLRRSLDLIILLDKAGLAKRCK